MAGWTVEREQALSAFVRERAGAPWTRVKQWISDGKVFVDGAPESHAGRRLCPGERVELRMTAPRPRDRGREIAIVFEDAHVVVIDKPAGVSSVPYVERRPEVAVPARVETGTAMDLVRDAWRRMGRPATSTPLHVVHRIDKETSGLLVFAKSKRAEIALAAQLRAHDMERTYLCVAHGDVRDQTIDTRLVADRGDGLRGSARGREPGKRAVTHVRALERLARGPATLCEVRLETGKTHQIRIHLAERGHPLVGERVYVRDWRRQGRAEIEAPRLMLHAATLGFAHPTSGARVGFEAPLPDDFDAVVRALA